MKTGQPCRRWREAIQLRVGGALEGQFQGGGDGVGGEEQIAGVAQLVEKVEGEGVVGLRDEIGGRGRRGYDPNEPLIAMVAQPHAGKLPLSHSFASLAPGVPFVRLARNPSPRRHRTCCW